MTVRRLALAAAAAAGLFSVTACEKPAPQITVYSSGRVINVDASRYCFDECVEHAVSTKSIRVRRTSVVGIDVPKRVAENGWVLQVGDQVIFSAPHKESHFALDVPNIARGTLPVTIVEAGDPASATGVWKLQFLIQD